MLQPLGLASAMNDSAENGPILLTTILKDSISQPGVLQSLRPTTRKRFLEEQECPGTGLNDSAENEPKLLTTSGTSLHHFANFMLMNVDRELFSGICILCIDRP